MSKLRYTAKTFFTHFTFIVITVFCVFCVRVYLFLVTYTTNKNGYKTLGAWLHVELASSSCSIFLVSICSFFLRITKHIVDIVERLHCTCIMFCISRFYFSVAFRNTRNTLCLHLNSVSRDFPVFFLLQQLLLPNSN